MQRQMVRPAYIRPYSIEAGIPLPGLVFHTDFGRDVIDDYSVTPWGAVLPSVNGKTVDRFGKRYLVGADQPRHTGLGVLLEGQATNVYPYGEAPQDTTLTLTAQDYTVQVWAGSATIGGVTATPGNPATFTASVGDYPITVSVDAEDVQVEAGDIATSYIPTNGTALTRATDAADVGGNGYQFDLANSPELQAALLAGECTVFVDFYSDRDEITTGVNEGLLNFATASSFSSARGIFMNAGAGAIQCGDGYQYPSTPFDYQKGVLIRAAMIMGGGNFWLNINGVSGVVKPYTPQDFTKMMLHTANERGTIYAGVGAYNRPLSDVEVPYV